MPPKGIFKGVVFCISGKLSQARKDYEEQITRHGGSIAGSVTTAVTYLISSEDDVKASPVKVAAAMGRGTPILQEGFVGACIGAKKLLGHEFFIVKGAKRKAAPKGAARPTAKKVKVAAIPPGPVKTTDKVAVHPKSLLVGKAEVVVTETKAFGGTSLIWDAELVQSDPAAGKDKYYNLQLLASVPEQSSFYVVHHWGKTGLDGTVHVGGPYDSVETARVDFKKKYRQKTGNVWGAVDATFIEVPGKFKLLAREDEKAEDFRWQYYLHNKVDGKKLGWYDYEKDAAKNIEKYWRQYNTNEGLGVRLVQTDHFKYEVNFTEMFQTNTKSGMRRVIRRLKAGEKPDPAAPDKIPDKADPKPDAPEADESDEDDEDDDAEEEEEVEEGGEPAAAAAPAEAKPAAEGRKAPPAEDEADAAEAPKPAAGGRKAPPAEEAEPAAAGGGRKAPDAADAETEAGSPVPAAAAGDDDETMAPTLPMDGLKKRG